MAALLAPSHISTDHTTSTVVSDYFAQSGAGSTALTSPSLYSPTPGKPHRLLDIDEEAGRLTDLGTTTQNADESLDGSLYADDPPEDPAIASPPQDIRRGPSVKSRASTYEQSLSGRSTAGLEVDIDRPKSRAASPFRLPPSPSGDSLHVPQSEQRRGMGRPQSPNRLPVAQGRRSRAQGAQSPSRSASPLRLPQPSAGDSHGQERPLPASPYSHRSGSSANDLPHSPCSTMPDPLYEPALPAARHSKRVPVPVRDSAYSEPSPNHEQSHGPTSARDMIAQWETGRQGPRATSPGSNHEQTFPNPVRQTEPPSSPSPRRTLPQRYLDNKPLPIPTATTIPASGNASLSPNNHRLPPRGVQMPSPLNGQQTPDSRTAYSSPSRWSPVQSKQRTSHSKSNWISTSPEKSTGKLSAKRSPFKDIVNKFTGRKREKEHGSPYGDGYGAGPNARRQMLDDENGWFAQAQPGMNGGVVYCDRMGDEEMASPQCFDQDTIRSSAVLFLSPSPVSSVTAWGSWLTAWATLSSSLLSITYAPTVPGGSPDNTTPYAAIPKPSPESRPEVELSMRDCVEVRSLRPSEVRGRGIPPVPEGGGSEVLEIAFSHGLKRYVAVEGVAGRLGWVSAIWDVLLACKQEPGADMNLPPPSPSLVAYSSTVNHIVLPRGLHDAPVQRYGDSWVAAGELEGSQSARGTPVRSLPATPDGELLPPRSLALAPGTVPFDFKPGEIIPRDIKLGDTISTFRSGIPSPLAPAAVAAVPNTSRLHEVRATNSEKDLPPPPTSDLSRPGLVEERIQTWTAGDIDTSYRPLPSPRSTAEPPLLTAYSLAASGNEASESTHVGDKGSANNSLGASSAATLGGSGTSVPLRKALVQMFDAATAEKEDASGAKRTRSVVMEERIRAWQPNADDTPAPLSRASTRREAESTVSVDPSDLNPSRSASQIRPRVESEVGLNLEAVNTGLTRELPTVPEAASSPRDRSFGPRAQKTNSPAPLPVKQRAAMLLAVDTVEQPRLSPRSVSPVAPKAASSSTSASPVATPRMNPRVLAAAAVFEPAIADRVKSAPSTMSKRKAVSLKPEEDVSSANAIRTPLSTTRTFPRPEPRSDTEAISEIRSVRSGLRSVRTEDKLVDSPTPMTFETAPLNWRKAKTRTPPTKVEGTRNARPAVITDVVPSKRAALDADMTSEVSSLVRPDATFGSDRDYSSTVEAVESSMPPSLPVPVLADRALAGAASDVEDIGEQSSVISGEGISDDSGVPNPGNNVSAQQLDDMRAELSAISTSVGGLGTLLHSKGEKDTALSEGLASRLGVLDENVRYVQDAVHGMYEVPPAFAQRFDALGSDLAGLQMAVDETSAQIAAIATQQALLGSPTEDQEKDLPPMPEETFTEVPEPRLPEINAKLDALAHLIQELLQRQSQLAEETAGLAAAAVASQVAAKETEVSAEEEAPSVAEAEARSLSPVVEPATAAQLDAVAGMVSKLEAERALQAQQTADIARYLGDLNGWLEKFVQNSGGELESMSRRLEGMAGDTVLVPEIHGMLAQQAMRPVGEGGVQAQRVDALVGMMAEERERQQQQVNVVEHVIGLLDKQRNDNENLLRAVATDLTSEIRGERVKFIDAMQQATSMNMQIHVDEFKKALTNEVSLSMRELGELREQKKALQHQIADLFSLMAKFGEETRAPPGMFPPSPGSSVPPGPRSLPLPPH